MEPMTHAWADHVDERLEALKRQNDVQDQKLADGNVLMTEISTKVSTLTDRALPVIEAMEGMQRGIHVIGGIGLFVGRAAEFLWRWARRAAKVGLSLLAAWLFYKAMLSGHTLGEAWEIATKVLR
jgi:hypothetical protein